jgi:hypothetical protein
MLQHIDPSIYMPVLLSIYEHLSLYVYIEICSTSYGHAHVSTSVDEYLHMLQLMETPIYVSIFLNKKLWE